MQDKKKTNISFLQVITSLLDADTPFPPRYLHQFSDLSIENLEKLRTAWQQVTLKRKLNILDDLIELFLVDTQVSFYDLGRLALQDDNPYIRAKGIQLLDECEDLDLVPVYIQLAEQDSVSLVRGMAAFTLGTYVLRGEVDEIPEKTLTKIEETLLNILKGADLPLVRMRALEAMGYSSSQEVSAFIKTAVESGNKDWICSALIAMGRSADEQWEDIMVNFLQDPEVEIQQEAVQAVGELGLDSARETLLNLLEDDSLNEEVHSAVIKSLSKIGGEGVKEALLGELGKAEDDDKADFISECLDMLDFNTDYGLFDIFDLEPPNLDDLDQIVDLTQEDGEDKV